ncbi:hypothetical protein OH76DRAFT_1404846 [Lentinus brumalis]|uniref:Metallothionein n=1 Tax=Lentinus brumalis TaxID=2498619 RepID=A0A371D6V0_9APHY|nr:hypothetical protein OH76DRAFT_1404846 [Polyporus brumalis]
MIAVSTSLLSFGLASMFLQTADVTKNAACGSTTCNCGATCACKPGECKC